MKARLELIDRLRRDEEERHKEALQAIDRQLREEKERHKDTLEGMERDREMVRVVLDLEQQFLTESRVKDLERQLVTETRAKTSEAIGNVEDAPGVAAVSVWERSRRSRGG